jgi:hypothetical protein
MTLLPPALGGAPTEPLEVGRATRVVAPAQRSALGVRDGGCRFPDCDRPLAWCEGHHLRHWLHGGATDLANLLLVCRAHHHAVHEGGWRLHRHADGTSPRHHPTDDDLRPEPRPAGKDPEDPDRPEDEEAALAERRPGQAAPQPCATAPQPVSPRQPAMPKRAAPEAPAPAASGLLGMLAGTGRAIEVAEPLLQRGRLVVPLDRGATPAVTDGGPPRHGRGTVRR